MHLADKIADRRVELQLRQVELANIVGVSQAAISQIEHGKMNPNVPTLFRIAATLGWTMGELFEGVTDALNCDMEGVPESEYLRRRF